MPCLPHQQIGYDAVIRASFDAAAHATKQDAVMRN